MSQTEKITKQSGRRSNSGHSFLIVVLPGDIALKYRVGKYPTLKLFRDGKMVRKEYRGPRRVHAILSYIRSQLSNHVIKYQSLDDILALRVSTDKFLLISCHFPKIVFLLKHERKMIGFFEKNDSAHFNSFVKVASALRDDCGFYSLFG